MGMAMAQSASGLGVRVLFTFDPSQQLDAADDLRNAGLPVTAVGPVGGRLLPRHPGTHDALLKELAEVDLVHIHGLWEDVQYRALLAAKQAGRPAVITPHGMFSEWAMNQKALKKKLYLALRLRPQLRTAARLHFATAEEARQASRLNIGPKTLVEPHGLDLGEFRNPPPAGEFRKKFPQLAGRPIVMFMGRLHPVKGLDLLIPAFARAGLPDAVLVLAGPDEGGYEQTVRQMIHANGLDDRVIFTGMLFGSDRIAALIDADLFVLPSYMENFGLVALEALAAASPVVLSDQVNFCDYVRAHDFADIVPCQADALATAIAARMADPARLSRDGQAGRSWALDHFDWSAIARRWHGHYEQVLNKA